MSEYPKSISEAKKFEYHFWKNKPIDSFNENTTSSTQIADDSVIANIYEKNDPTELPNNMRWMEVNMNDDIMLENIIKFLKSYYLIDLTNKFRLDYTLDFLKWSLGTDGFMIVIMTNDIICGVVGADIKNITICDKTDNFGVVDFLCVHPIFRQKKLVCILINEIIRKIAKCGIYRGCFTAERCIPSPIATMRYYHRPINYVKLQKYGFANMGENPEIIQKQFDLTNKLSNNYIPMQEKHISKAYELYILFMNKFKFYCNYSQQQFKSLLIDNKFTKSYVILKNDEVIDFCSYYELPYTIENIDDKINAGYIFLHSCNNVSIDEIIDNLLIIMKNNNLDLFNITDTMLLSNALLTKTFIFGEDSDVEDYCKIYRHMFLKGSGKLHINLFNWKCPKMSSNEISWFPL